MAITVPLPGAEVSAETFGQPVANQLNKAPLGPIVIARKSSAQSGIGQTVVDVNGLTATWTVLTGHRYKVTLNVRLTQMNAAGTVSFLLQDQANAGGINANADYVVGNHHLCWFAILEGLPPGSVTRKIRAMTSAGLMQVSGSPYETMLLVEDLGAP
jgi:hypothetical protein